MRGLLLYLITLSDTLIPGRAPLGEESAHLHDNTEQSQETYILPCFLRDSNPQSHQAIGLRPTP